MFETAKVAGLGWHYLFDYFFFSEYVHSTISGIISLEGEVERGRVLQTTAFVATTAAAYAAQGLAIPNLGRHIAESSRLLETLCDLIDKGVFRDYAGT